MQLQSITKEEKLINNILFLYILNQDIAESFKNANDQFNSINAMAESNANDTTNVAEQAGMINRIVDKIAILVKQDE